MDTGWWIQRGPNGGYVAAVILRALTLAVDDPARTPRSLTVHYLAPPGQGGVQIVTAIERAGRTLTTVTGRLMQGDKLLALAVAAFATGRPGPSFSDAVMPDVAPPESLEPPAMVAPDGTAPVVVPMRERFDERWAVGPPPFTGADEARAGGWLRLVEPRPIDHLLVACLTDAWVPSVFARLTPGAGFSVPTIDLTVHFRGPLPPPGVADDDFLLVAFQTRMLEDGFMEEDGEVWTRDGVLLAQSRQLAAVLTVPG